MKPVDLTSLKQASHWLLNYSFDVTSQCGEDGIILECLKLLHPTNGWCVEFGAWDGKHLSNTYNLIANHGYRAVLIEANAKKFLQLDGNFEYRERIHPIQAFVGFTEADGLDSLLRGRPVPFDFDVLSVDIDGNDYHVWDAVQKYRPKLVVIEYNPTIGNSVVFVQERDASVSQGSSPAALVALGKSKGYELVAATAVNLIFADGCYYSRFQIPDNSLDLMRDDSACPQLFVTYDGSVKLAHKGDFGRLRLRWHEAAELKENQIQVVPKFLRRHPPDYSRWQSYLFILWFQPERLWRAFKRRATRLWSR